jgi:hypothetical protein
LGAELEERDDGALDAATPPPASVVGPAAGTSAAEALALAREALIAAHPDAVPELIAGATADELRSSVASAKAAFARALETARSALAAEPVSPGATARTLPVNAEAMSPSAKIAWAINHQAR